MNDNTPELMFVERHLLDAVKENWQRLLTSGLVSSDSEIGKVISALFDGARVVPAKISLAKESINGSEHNDWFISLEDGHQKVLSEDKWALASSMFKAGFDLSTKINAIPLLAVMGSVADLKSQQD